MLGFFRKTVFTPFETAIFKELEAQFEPKYAGVLRSQLSEINKVHRVVNDSDIEFFKLGILGKIEYTRSVYLSTKNGEAVLKAILTVGDEEHKMRILFSEGRLNCFVFRRDVNMEKYRERADVSLKILTSFQRAGLC